MTSACKLLVALAFSLTFVTGPVASSRAGGPPPDHGNGGNNGPSGDHGNDQGQGNGGGQGQGNGGDQDHGNGNGGGQGNGNGGGDQGNGGDEEGPACGAVPGDADQLAAVRASVADQCDCAGSPNHGRYVSCAAHAVNAAVRRGDLRDACRDEVLRCAARSTCGRPGFVTCCRTDFMGNSRCSVRRSAAACRAPMGGSASVGQTSSCCDACVPGSTTTTTVPETSTTTQVSTTTTTEESTTSTTSVPTTTTTVGPVCGNGIIEPGEQCDPPGSTCPPDSSGGAILECLPGCVCGSTTTTTTPSTTSSTSTTGSTSTSTSSSTSSTSSTSMTTTTMAPGTTSTTTTTIESTTTTTTTSTSTTSSTSTTTTNSTSTSTSSSSTTTTSTSTTTTNSTSTSTSSSSTTTTSTSSTTTTTVAFTQLAFSVSTGTTNCGAAGLATPPAAPTSGNVDSDTGCTTSITSLGLGCLYFGGGAATVIPPGAIPDGSTSLLNISGGTLTGANTGNSDTCTVGDGPGKHCINGHCATNADCGAGTCSVAGFCGNGANPNLTCTSDANCGGAAGSCGPDANCYFGPPLPIFSPPPFGALTTCVLNVVHSTASGTANATTGASSISLPLTSRVYISGNTASPCPKCLSGSCDPTWKTAGAIPSPNSGNSCTAVGTKQTTNQCLPTLGGFQAPLPVNLTPLTTGTTSETTDTGIFCPGQLNAGAFGQVAAQCITQTGQTAGDITDQLPHNAHLVSVFCIPATGNPAVDSVSDLPGPGAFSLNGNSQVR